MFEERIEETVSKLLQKNRLSVRNVENVLHFSKCCGAISWCHRKLKRNFQNSSTELVTVSIVGWPLQGVVVNYW